MVGSLGPFWGSVARWYQSTCDLWWCHNEHDDVSNHQPHDFYSTVYSGADQRKHQSSASLAFVWGIDRWPVNSPHKGPVTRKMFPFDDVIMTDLGRGDPGLQEGPHGWCSQYWRPHIDTIGFCPCVVCFCRVFMVWLSTLNLPSMMIWRTKIMQSLLSLKKTSLLHHRVFMGNVNIGLHSNYSKAPYSSFCSQLGLATSYGASCFD